MASDLNIPRDANEVTVGWLRRALSVCETGAPPAVETFEVENIGAGSGLFSEVLRCHLEWKDKSASGPETVILKMPSSDRRTLRMARRLRLYRREYDYYRHAASLSRLKSPQLHFGRFAGRSHRFVLVLQDLSLTHHTALDKSATPTQAKSAIRAVALLHAQYWNKVHQPHLSCFPDYLKQQRPLVQLAYLAYLPRALSRFSHCFSDEQRRLAESYGPRIADHMDEMAMGHRTFTHGDFRLANLFFGNGGDEEIAAIDWQNCGKHSGLRDVAYFLSSSVSPRIRRDIEREVLEEYHRAIRRSGVKGYTFSDCWSDYRRVMLSCLIGPVLTCGSLDLADDEHHRTMEIGLRRTLAAVEELDADEFMPSRRRTFSIANAFSALSRGAYRVYSTIR